MLILYIKNSIIYIIKQLKRRKMMAKFLVLVHNERFKVFNVDGIKKGIRNFFEVDCQEFNEVKTRTEFEKKIREMIKREMNQKYIHVHYVKAAKEKIKEIIK